MTRTTTRTPSRSAGLALAVVALLTTSLAAQIEEALQFGSSINDQVGWAVALSGDTAALGAPGRHDNSLGHVLVHQRNGGSWDETQSLVGSTSVKLGWFGAAVALEGDVLVAGDWGESDGLSGQPGFHRGAAFVFRRADSASPFVEEARLQPVDLVEHDRFGWALALSGDVLAVSARGADDGGDDSGAVYVFRHAAGSWTQEARLTAPAPAAGDQFGLTLALDGDSLAVGAVGVDAAADDAGAVFVFVHAAGSWSLQQTLTSASAARQEHFGAGLALDGERLAVGVPGRALAGLPGAGAVELWQRSGSTWSLEAQLADPAPGGFDGFGSAVALDGERALVGAPYAETPEALSGRAQLFERQGGVWSPAALLSSSQLAPAVRHGHALALDGPLAAIGAPAARSGATNGLGLTTFFGTLP